MYISIFEINVHKIYDTRREEPTTMKNSPKRLLVENGLWRHVKEGEAYERFFLWTKRTWFTLSWTLWDCIFLCFTKKNRSILLFNFFWVNKFHSFGWVISQRCLTLCTKRIINCKQYFLAICTKHSTWVYSHIEYVYIFSGSNGIYILWGFSNLRQSEIWSGLIFF